MKVSEPEVTVKLVSCFVLNRLDYCKSLLAGPPTESLSTRFKMFKKSFSPHFRQKETRTRHFCSEKSPVTTCLSTNELQAVFSLLQDFEYSSSFEGPYTIYRTSRSACDITRLSVLRCRLKQFARLLFQDLHLRSGTHCQLISVKLAPHTLSRLIFSAPSKLCASLNESY